MKKNKPRIDFKALLGWVNDIRRAANLKPIRQLYKGERNNCYFCPLARSINGTVTQDAYRVGGPGSVSRSLPEDARLFVKRFDRGNLPKFQLKRKAS